MTETKYPDHVLEGWLCIVRAQFTDEDCWGPVAIPEEIYEDLEAKGWVLGIKVSVDGEDEPNPFALTEKGLMVTDVCGPEWGLETIGY